MACRAQHLKVARVRTADGEHEVVGVQLPARYERAIVAALREQAPDLGALRAAAPNAQAAPGADDGAGCEPHQVLLACAHAPACNAPACMPARQLTACVVPMLMPGDENAG